MSTDLVETADVVSADIDDLDIPLARVLPPRPLTLTQYLLDAIRDLQQRAVEDYDAGSDSEWWMAVGGVQALQGVLDCLSDRGED